MILARAAKLFGYQADYQKYRALAEKIKQALNEKYLDRATGWYGSGLQTELSVALHWGLIPEELKPTVAKHLAARVAADNKHIDVGLLGSKAILNALSENGYAELAWQVAAQETYPSWGWWIVNGATTLPENWALDAGHDISMNHIMFGEISAWYYKALGGIFPDETQPGFKNILLKPNFVAGLDFFTAEHNSPYGRIVSSWEKTGRDVEYHVTIPANSTATLFLKDVTIREAASRIKADGLIKTVKSEDGLFVLLLNSGDYRFSLRSE